MTYANKPRALPNDGAAPLRAARQRGWEPRPDGHEDHKAHVSTTGDFGIRRVFYDYASFVQWCERGADRSFWSQTRHAEELELAKLGWNDELPDVERFVSEVQAKVTSLVEIPSFVQYHDVAGSEVDIDRYLAGEPECLLESVPTTEHKEKQHVRLIVSTALGGGASDAVAIARGKAIAAFVTVLRLYGINPEVWAVDTTGHHSEGRTNFKRACSYAVQVQAPDKIADLGQLLFAVGHPGVQRTLCFAAYHGEDEYGHSGYFGDAGYGWACPIRREDVPEAPGEVIFLDTLGYGNASEWTETNASEWIVSHLQSIFNTDED